MLAGLLTASHVMSLEQLPGAVEAHAADAGLTGTMIYLADLQQDVLRLMPGTSVVPEGGPGEIGIDDSTAGRAYQAVETTEDKADEDRAGRRWWVPLLDGTERLGVLRVDSAFADEEVHRSLDALAALVALMVVSKRSTSDSYARLVRTRPMTVSAEMQWKLMPPLTFATDRVEVSAALEPAYEIGGDAFDYALAGDVLHLALFDAVGHDTSSGLTANLAVAACRSSRRRGEELTSTSRAIEEVLNDQFGGSRFVTAVVAHLHTPTGTLVWANHGHPPPVVLRDGRAIVLDREHTVPLGTGLLDEIDLCTEQLEPGDRLLLYTDGVTEARDSDGEEFGLDRFVDFVLRHDAEGFPVPETLRRLIHHVLDHHQARLVDDATVLLAEWTGDDSS